MKARRQDFYKIAILMMILLCHEVRAGESASRYATQPNAVHDASIAEPPAIFLAKIWQDGQDPSNYWVSEKLDGVRAVWNGHELRFRSGHTVAAPAWFIHGLPAEPLDGELWLGHGRFDELSAIVRKAVPRDEAWRQVHYMVFELPGALGSFTQRVAKIQSVVKQAGVPWLQAVPQYRVGSQVELMARYKEVLAAGGEGLMLHRADAIYHAGRSDDLLKLKPALDAEAVVVGYRPGKGRYAGMVGALLVENSTGQRFGIGSGLDDATRKNPPAVGTTISYRYQHLTDKGVPRFPRYWRVRAEGL